MGKYVEEKKPSFLARVKYAILERILRPIIVNFYDKDIYTPRFDVYRPQLESVSNYTEDERLIRDQRKSIWIEDGSKDLTLTTEGLEDALRGIKCEASRVLEIGPKYGIHSLWIDQNLHPSELVFCDFSQDQNLHAPWKEKIKSPHQWVFGDIRESEDLLGMDQFDLTLFLGVLYHNFNHMDILVKLNRVTKLGGALLLETTTDPRKDACVQLKWTKSGVPKAVPTIDALRLMLAWSGWGDVKRLTSYRQGSSEELLICTKEREIDQHHEFSDLVRKHKI